MSDDEERVRGLMDQGLSVSVAWHKVLDRHTKADLVEELVTVKAAATKRSLRQRALDETTHEQLSLLQSYDATVRLDDDHFKSGQSSTRAEHAAHLAWAGDEFRRKVGIVERKQQRLEQESDLWLDDMPLGDHIFAHTTCAYECGRPWDETDPFELAHDFPVHGASDDNTVRWAHRSCNRGDGA